MVETVTSQPSARAPSMARPPGRRAGLGARAAALIRRYRLAPYLLVLPSLAAIALVLLWPVLQVALYSFQNYGLPQTDGATPTQWVGLSNFTATFSDPEFWLALRITVLSAAATVTLTLLTGTLVGLLLNRLGRVLAAVVSTAALMAWATPPVSASVLFYWLFNPDGGLVDWSLARLPHWLVGSTDWAGFNWTTGGALPAYTVATLLVVWQGFPFVAVAVLAGLKTVPAELLEAARVDGAGAWPGFWKITYPLLKPIFLVLLLFSVIWDFNVFTQTYILTGDLGNRDEYNLSLYPLRVFWRILFPLIVPGLIATSVFSFITAYNEFIVALTFLGQAHGSYTLPIYVTYFFGRGGAQWGPIMAASTLYTIPVVVFFLLVQRRMTGGLVAGAVKG